MFDRTSRTAAIAVRATLVFVLAVSAVAAGAVVAPAAATATADDPVLDRGDRAGHELPEALCRASDNSRKENRNGREVWGPTEMNSQIGNQDLLVSTNQMGTVSVFKYPNPSYADQIKHHAFDRRDPYYDREPNAGAMIGLIVDKSGTKEFTWIRDWGPVSTSDPGFGENHTQSYPSNFSDTVRLTTSNDRLGLNVTILSAVPKDLDVLIRDVNVTAQSGSPVTDVEVVSYENFNLVADKDNLAPTQDWCSEGENEDNATYFSSLDAVVHYKGGIGAGDGEEFDVGTAMAFDEPSTQHQVAGDDYRGDHPNDPYALLSNGTVSLPGYDQYTGQTSVAMTKDLAFGDGQGSARVYLAGASYPTPFSKPPIMNRTKQKIRDARNLSLPTVRTEKEQFFRDYVENAPMPNTTNPNVTRTSRRALISIAQIWDNETLNEHGFAGTIVASIATQAPYGADWVRDGAYFNYIIDRFMGPNGTGIDRWVNKHNRYYMSVQQNKGGPCPQHCHNNNKYYNYADLIGQVHKVPEGGWAMNYYADGLPAGPIGGEIDETSYGAWTMWDHYVRSKNDSYLKRIYPAIRKVGNRLTYDCVDDSTGLQCPRPEDDHTEKTQTIIGGASAHAGLMAATEAASRMYQITGNTTYRDQARAYGTRRDELGEAIDIYYWNESGGGFYGKKSGFPSPRAGMPAFLRSFEDPRMQRHMDSMWEKNLNSTFSGSTDQGQYESKSMIGLGMNWRGYIDEKDPSKLDKLQDGLEWIADKHSQEDTAIMGEAWIRETYSDDEVVSAVSQPHVWEQSLFYMSALIAFPPDNDAHTRIGKDVYEEWRKHDAEMVSYDVESGLYTQGDVVSATAEIKNDATVSQDYFVQFEVKGPDGNEYVGEKVKHLGPIAPNGTANVTLNWTVSSTTGSHDGRVTVWKAVNDTAEEPTALGAAQYRHTELANGTETGAFDVIISKGVLGETGTVPVSADDNAPGDPGEYQWVPFKNDYQDPIVVAKPASQNDADPAHARVRNVSSDGFYVQVEEWDYLQDDAGHPTENVSYLAIEKGKWTLLNGNGDGVQIEAGTLTTGQNWQSVSFNQNFDEQPVVMSVVGSESGDGSYNDIEEGKVTRNRNLGKSGFESRLFMQEGGENVGCSIGCGGIPAEIIYYVAMEPGNGTNGPSNTKFEVGATGNTVTDAIHTVGFRQSYSSGGPSFVSDMTTTDGSDPANVRYTNRSTTSTDVWVEEEQSGDSETSHTDENVSYAAFGTGGSKTDVYGDISSGLIGEVGRVTVNAVDMNTGAPGPYQNVSLAGQYDDPVVVAKPMTDDVANYSHIRTRNLGNESFQIQIEPWDYLQDGSPSGTYAPEDVFYIVMESGHYTLPDGTEVEADKFSTGQNWNQPNGGAGFNQSFPSTPVVVTTVNSESGDGSYGDIYEGKITRNRNVGTSTFEARLQNQEGGENIGCAVGCGGIPAETTSYIAFEQNVSTNVGTPFEVDTNTDNVGDAVDTESFTQSFASAPAVVADTQTYAGSDTGSLRLAAWSNTSYDSYFEEEKSSDSEIGHIGEGAGFIAFESLGGIFNEKNELPFADYNVTPATPDQGQNVTFDASNSTDFDGVITDYDWDYDGDGNSDAATQSDVVAHTYDKGGFYSPTLKVTDGDGGVDRTSQSVYVNWLPDVLWQHTVPGSAEMNTEENVTFNASRSDDRDGAVYDYRWDFDGDGTFDANVSNQSSVNHSYPDPANYSAVWNYTVELELVDDDAATNSSTRNVSVKPNCIASVANYDTEDWTISFTEAQFSSSWWQNDDVVPDCDETLSFTEQQKVFSFWQDGVNVR